MEKDFRSYIRLSLMVAYRGIALPTEFISAYFVPEPSTLWEIKYQRKQGSIDKYIPTMLIKLESEKMDEGFIYKETAKINLLTGNKVRKVSGNLQDLIGKKIFVTMFKQNYSRFYINFPANLVEDNPYRDRIKEIFGI